LLQGVWRQLTRDSIYRSLIDRAIFGGNQVFCDTLNLAGYHWWLGTCAENLSRRADGKIRSGQTWISRETAYWHRFRSRLGLLWAPWSSRSAVCISDCRKAAPQCHLAQTKFKRQLNGRANGSSVLEAVVGTFDPESIHRPCNMWTCRCDFNCRVNPGLNGFK
jgi:hypothetical protein